MGHPSMEKNSEEVKMHNPEEVKVNDPQARW